MFENFGKLQKVAPRNVFGHEALGFTPWLARPENLAFLGEAVYMPLQLIGTEQAIGTLKADILARNTADDGLVLIENQIEATDHGHLGQIISYTSQLNTLSAIIWIAAKFKEEHIKALTWLNDIASKASYSGQFIGVEIEVFQINESLAPQFKKIVHSGHHLKKQVMRKHIPGVHTSSTVTIEQKIRALLTKNPLMSGRAIARQIDCSPTTASYWKTIIQMETTVNQPTRED